MINEPNPAESKHELEVINVGALESISRAEIDVSIATARRYPRTLSVVKKNMLSFATLDRDTAESCFYSLPRGGKNIQGPSVRLAEIAVSCYGNIRAGSRILQTVTTGDNPHVVVQAVATDLENNITVSIEKRRRITKKKSKEFIDEDDINLAANAGSAIAFRDAVFKIVPLALIKPVFDAAKQVAVGDASTLADRRSKCVSHFSKMGISQDRVLAKLERKSMEDVTLEDVETLLGLHNAVKDGEVTLDEAFPSVVKTPQFDVSPPAEPKTAPAKPKLAKPAEKPVPQATAPVAIPQPIAPPSEPEVDLFADPQPVQESPPAPQPAVSPSPSAGGSGVPVAPVSVTESPEVTELRRVMAAAHVGEAQVMAFVLKKLAHERGAVMLGQLKGTTVSNLTKGLSVPGSTIAKQIQEVQV